MNEFIIGLICSSITALLLSLLIGNPLISLFLKFKLNQNIKVEVLPSHKRKEGTPTFGGIIFIIATAIPTILVASIRGDFKGDEMIILCSLFTFGFIGFVDDSLKTFRRKNQGLTSRQKFLAIAAVASCFAYYGYKHSSIGTAIILPFKMNLLELGIWYIPFIMFFYTATTNAVNLTDGLDGLATSVTILVMTFFTIISFCYGKYIVATFCGSITASLLGFLRYNAFPAKIMMGDTGALALGGVIATVAMILKLPIIVMIVGGIYMFETVTTIIQITYFKLTGRRVFKMAPIHHSFELSGWNEVKIVAVFSVTTTILCMIGFFALFSPIP